MPAGEKLHTMTSHAEVAAAALGSVYAANELGKAIADDDKQATDHYLKAAIGAAVAVGAFHQLQNKTEQHHHSRHGEKEPHAVEEDHPGHRRRLLEEAIGAYGLGKELLGDRRHHVAHLIEEAVGAVGLIRDITTRAT